MRARDLRRLIVLDFDGVLLDTERTGIDVWRDLLGDAPPEARGALSVRTDGTLDRDALRRDLAGTLGRRRTRALWSEFERRNRARADLLDARPGVRPFLAHCRERGHRLAIASGNGRDWVEGHLQRLGIRSAFHSVHCAGPGVRTKPAPDTYLGALRACAPAGPPFGLLAVEDSYAGLAAAATAGLPAVWLTDAPDSALPPGPVARRVRALDELIGTV
ncbi:HAD hydrolase-like protein [Streptomyces sp. NBC_01723]|uniref:HAD family hydrolase n=1 Tax=unclassified Streptomyces TaxID=2593676 RepID=UPI00277FE038|nr:MULTISPECIES: HAD family hydrolase [unclassified Streptomyces]MDQ0406968.1 putative hydrolase of the HAD superfamily [Streptomyces sp. DSM 40167]